MAVPEILEVDLGPGVRAGFTPAGWNLSTLVGEDAAGAASRRAALAAWAGAPLTWLRQVHGVTVHAVPGRDGRARADPAGEDPTADASVSARRGTGLAVLVADCVPVLLADAAAGVVGVVHAGRQGVASGVVPAAVDALVAAGARPAGLRAVLGPAICGRCYEVPAALRDEVAALVPEAAGTTSWGTPALDLPRAVVAQLTAAGVGEVRDLALCTLADDRWYSHRGAAAGRPAGRLAGVVALPAAATGRVATGRAGPLG